MLLSASDPKRDYFCHLYSFRYALGRLISSFSFFTIGRSFSIDTHDVGAEEENRGGISWLERNVSVEVLRKEIYIYKQQLST